MAQFKNLISGMDYEDVVGKWTQAMLIRLLPVLVGIVVVFTKPISQIYAQRLFWLGTLGGNYSYAYGVSADGSVVVGYAENASGDSRAFRWTQAGGMEDLNQTYTTLLTNGSVLEDAYAISPDGRYIVGWGFNAVTGRTEAFLLDAQGPSSVEAAEGHMPVLEVVPNPMVEQTSIRFSLPKAGQVRLEIVDLLGRSVRVLVDDVRPAGLHTMVWDGGDGSGNAVPAGVYVCRLSVAGRTVTTAIIFAL